MYTTLSVAYFATSIRQHVRTPVSIQKERSREADFPDFLILVSSLHLTSPPFSHQVIYSFYARLSHHNSLLSLYLLQNYICSEYRARTYREVGGARAMLSYVQYLVASSNLVASASTSHPTFETIQTKDPTTQHTTATKIAHLPNPFDGGQETISGLYIVFSIT